MSFRPQRRFRVFCHALGSSDILDAGQAPADGFVLRESVTGASDPAGTPDGREH